MRSSPASGRRRLSAWTGPCTGSSSIWSARIWCSPRCSLSNRRPSGVRRCRAIGLARAYRESAAVLLDAFGQPGVLDRSYQGPLGAATGAERLKIRMYDLLAHGWDLAQALGRPVDLPEDAVEESLAFARADGRAVRPGGGCFGPARHVADAAPAIVRLVAFLGRDVPAA